MIFEILSDSKSFILILVASMLAYAHIMITMDHFNDPDVGAQSRMSYTLSFGELGPFDEMSSFQFFFFVIFSFFIPLVLMNMLIAIMGDTYGRV